MRSKNDQERIDYAEWLFRQCIEVNPNICGGRPVLKGTNFTIAKLLGEISDGKSLSTIAENCGLDYHPLKKVLNALSIWLDVPNSLPSL